MRRFVVLSILVIIAVNCSDDESNCKELEKTPSSRLRNHLFCEYESGVRPSLDKNKPTIVDIRMLPQYVEFVSKLFIMTQQNENNKCFFFTIMHDNIILKNDWDWFLKLTVWIRKHPSLVYLDEDGKKKNIISS